LGTQACGAPACASRYCVQGAYIRARARDRAIRSARSISSLDSARACGLLEKIVVTNRTAVSRVEIEQTHFF
jgi:hypothetical protein